VAYFDDGRNAPNRLGDWRIWLLAASALPLIPLAVAGFGMVIRALR
jgi:hypothetical protein